MKNLEKLKISMINTFLKNLETIKYAKKEKTKKVKKAKKIKTPNKIKAPLKLSDKKIQFQELMRNRK